MRRCAGVRRSFLWHTEIKCAVRPICMGALTTHWRSGIDRPAGALRYRRTEPHD